MKMISSLLCVFALLFVGVCNAETKTKFYENGQKSSEINYKDGKLHGLSTRWHENGKKSWEGNLKDGKVHGLSTSWYEDGQKKTEINWKDGKMHGLLTKWDENGQKKSEANYKDGQKIRGVSYEDGFEVITKLVQLEKVASFPDRYMGEKVYFKGVEVDGDVERSRLLEGKKFCVDLKSSRGKWFLGESSDLIITVSDSMAEAIMDDVRSDQVYPNCDVYCELSKIVKLGKMVPHAAIYMIVVYNRGGGISKTFYK